MTTDIGVKVKIGVGIANLGILRKINKRQLLWVGKRKHRSKVSNLRSGDSLGNVHKVCLFVGSGCNTGG